MGWVMGVIRSRSQEGSKGEEGGDTGGGAMMGSLGRNVCIASCEFVGATVQTTIV